MGNTAFCLSDLSPNRISNLSREDQLESIDRQAPWADEHERRHVAPVYRELSLEGKVD